MKPSVASGRGSTTREVGGGGGGPQPRREHGPAWGKVTSYVSSRADMIESTGQGGGKVSYVRQRGNLARVATPAAHHLVEHDRLGDATALKTPGRVADPGIRSAGRVCASPSGTAIAHLPLRRRGRMSAGACRRVRWSFANGHGRLAARSEAGATVSSTTISSSDLIAFTTARAGIPFYGADGEIEEEISSTSGHWKFVRDAAIASAPSSAPARRRLRLQVSIRGPHRRGRILLGEREWSTYGRDGSLAEAGNGRRVVKSSATAGRVTREIQGEEWVRRSTARHRAPPRIASFARRRGRHRRDAWARRPCAGPEAKRHVHARRVGLDSARATRRGQDRTTRTRAGDTVTQEVS